MTPGCAALYTWITLVTGFTEQGNISVTASTLHLLYIYSASTLHLLCIYSVSTLYLLYLLCICCIYYVSTVSTLNLLCIYCIYSASTVSTVCSHIALPGLTGLILARPRDTEQSHN